MSDTPKTVEEILEDFKREQVSLQKKYDENKLGWLADDGSAEQDFLVKQRKINQQATEAIDALRRADMEAVISSIRYELKTQTPVTNVQNICPLEDGQYVKISSLTILFENERKRMEERLNA